MADFEQQAFTAGTRSFAGRVVVVTGAASGFGAEIARRFAGQGARVAVLDLNGERAASVAGAFGGLALAADVTSRPQIEAAIRATVEAFGVPDIVVNNAGYTHRNRPLLEVDEATFDRVYAVNVKSDEAKIANAQVNDMAGLWAHPQLRARGRWRDVATPHGQVPALLPPGQSDAYMGPLPKVGQHTMSILAEFGLLDTGRAA